MGKWRTLLQKHKPALCGALTAAALLLAALLVWLAAVRPNAAKSRTETISDDYSTATVLEDGQTLTQTFAYDGNLLAVLVEFELPGTQPAGELEVTLTDADTGELLAASTGVMQYIVPGQYTVLGLDREVPATAGRRYRLALTPHYTGEGRLALGHSSGPALWCDAMQLDGADQNGTLALRIVCERIGGYLSRFFLLVAAAAAALAGLGVWAALRKKTPLHRLVFALVLGFGLLYATVLPPYAAPDEKYHINQSFTLACRWANAFSGEEWRMGHVPTTVSYRRATDFDPLLQDENTTVFTWRQYTSTLFAKTDAPFDSHAELDELQTDQNPIPYLPSAAAVFLAYLLHLGFTPALALGRLANLLVFAALASLAVRCAPFGRRVFAAVALLPMTLHLAASFSRDAVILGLCFAFTSLCLRALCGTERLTLRTALPLVTAGVLLAPGKLVYLPLAALLLAVPAPRWGRRPLAKKAGYLAACLVLALVVNQGMLTGMLGQKNAPDPQPDAAAPAQPMAVVPADAAALQLTPLAKAPAGEAPGDAAQNAEDALFPDAQPADPEQDAAYQQAIHENTLENYVRRLFYYRENGTIPTDAEVSYWCDAMREGLLSPVALAQSFFLNEQWLAQSQMNDPDYLVAMSQCLLNCDIVAMGDTHLTEIRREQGDEILFKAMFHHGVCEAMFAELGLAPGEMDGRIPLRRADLAADIDAARATLASQSTAAEQDLICYTPGYILTHLPDTVRLLVNTVVQNTDHYLRTLVGGSLSYYTLDLAWGWVLALYVLLLFAALPAAGAPLPGTARGVSAFAALACCALAVGGCLLWTPTYYETLYGLQGRYFLPVLPLLLLSCTPRRLAALQQDEETAGAALVCALCVVQAGVLLNIMLAVMAR